jgi:hypothetical protein
LQDYWIDPQRFDPNYVYEEGDPDCYRPEYRALVDIVLNYDSDATQLGSDEDSAKQYESEEWESVSDLYGTEKESDSSSHGSKPGAQLAPAHEWSDDCVSEKTEEEDVSTA